MRAEHLRDWLEESWKAEAEVEAEMKKTGEMYKGG